MNTRQAIYTVVLCCLMVPGAQLRAAEIGFVDSLIVSLPVQAGAETHVTVYSYNDEDLAGLDIPLKYGSAGDPIDLLRVVFAKEVSSWDVADATIDNIAKTVTLGLIADLGRPNSFTSLSATSDDLAALATLVFDVETGHTVSIDTFSTSHPERRLMFVHNDRTGEKPVVMVIKPEFKTDVEMAAKRAGVILPTEYALSLNYPNPFNPSTAFMLSLPEASDYMITIYNITGQAVRSFSGHLDAGWHEIKWDGTNNRGKRVATGSYFLNARAGTFSQTIKMILLK